MSAEDLEQYEADLELALFREYREACRVFSHVVETERRFYLANEVTVERKESADRVWFELQLTDAWVWDMYRDNRFIPSVRIVTYKDVNVEELPKAELDLDELRKKS